MPTCKNGHVEITFEGNDYDSCPLCKEMRKVEENSIMLEAVKTVSKTLTIGFINYAKLKDNLLLVKVGSKERPATPQDVEFAHLLLKEIVDGIAGVRILVVHNDFNWSEISIADLEAILAEKKAASEKP